jgi:hypothetical protein
LPTPSIEIFPFTLAATYLGPFVSDLFLAAAIFFSAWPEKAKR